MTLTKPDILTARQAAYLYGVTTSTINRWHKDKGFTAISNYPRKYLKTDIDAYILTLRGRGKPPKPIDNKVIVEHYLSGETAEAIGKIVGLSKMGVLNRLRKQGVKIRKTGSK